VAPRRDCCDERTDVVVVLEDSDTTAAEDSSCCCNLVDTVAVVVVPCLWLVPTHVVVAVVAVVGYSGSEDNAGVHCNIHNNPWWDCSCCWCWWCYCGSDGHIAVPAPPQRRNFLGESPGPLDLDCGLERLPWSW